MDLVLDEIKELLLIFLSVIMVLWLFIFLKSLTLRDAY